MTAPRASSHLTICNSSHADLFSVCSPPVLIPRVQGAWSPGIGQATEATVAPSLVSASACPNSPFPHTHTHTPKFRARWSSGSNPSGQDLPQLTGRNALAMYKGPADARVLSSVLFTQSHIQNRTKYLQRTIQVCLKTNWFIQTSREGHLWKLGRKLRRLTALRGWIFPGRTQPWPR